MYALGASVNIKSKSGGTAYFYAEKSEVKHLLKSAGKCVPHAARMIILLKE